jgi:hypothetical protein
VCRGSQAWPCPAQLQRSNQFPQPEENLFPHTIKEPTRFLLCGCSDRLARSRYVQRCTGLLSYPWPYTPLKPFFTKAPGLINHRLLLRCTCSSIVCSGATELLQLDRSNHILVACVYYDNIFNEYHILIIFTNLWNVNAYRSELRDRFDINFSSDINLLRYDIYYDTSYATCG